VRPLNNSSCGVSTAAIVWRPVLTVALLNNCGLQGTPAARRTSPRRSPTTVASPVGQYPGTCSCDGVYRQNDSTPVLCTVGCLLAVLTYGEARSDRIISYRIVSRYFVCYRSLMFQQKSAAYATVFTHMFDNKYRRVITVLAPVLYFTGTMI